MLKRKKEKKNIVCVDYPELLQISKCGRYIVGWVQYHVHYYDLIHIDKM